MKEFIITTLAHHFLYKAGKIEKEKVQITDLLRERLRRTITSTVWKDRLCLSQFQPVMECFC